MADLIFYDKVVSLNSETHKDLRIKPLTGFAYAAHTNSVPLVAVEFGDAGREYPITFVKASDGMFLPVAILGLRENENLFVDAQGKWDARYLPAFVRRYPFVPADVGQEEVVICFDENAPCFSREEGDLLFQDGKPTPVMENMLNLMREYQTQALRTQDFCKHLQEYDLLVESNAQAQLPDGSTFRLNGLYSVDEQRLQKLDKDQVHALFSTGELGLIYAHLLSLGNLQRLMERLGGRISN